MLLFNNSPNADEKYYRELHDTVGYINDYSINKKDVDELFCDECTEPCKFRKYIVQSMCCNNRACNKCHLRFLSSTNKPFCYSCKTVWTHANILNWFRSTDASKILRSRCRLYRSRSYRYLHLRENLSRIFKEHVAIHFPTLRKIQPVLEDSTFYSFIEEVGRFYRKKSYTDLSIDTVLAITKESVCNFVDFYDSAIYKYRDKKKLTKKKQAAIEAAGTALWRAISEMQSTIMDAILCICPKCSKAVLCDDDCTVDYTDCLDCGSVISKETHEVVTTVDTTLYSKADKKGIYEGQLSSTVQRQQYLLIRSKIERYSSTVI